MFPTWKAVGDNLYARETTRGEGAEGEESKRERGNQESVWSEKGGSGKEGATRKGTGSSEGHGGEGSIGYREQILSCSSSPPFPVASRPGLHNLKTLASYESGGLTCC